MLAMMLSGKCGQHMNSTAGAEEFPQPAQTKGVLLLAHLLSVRNIWLDIASAEGLSNMSGNSFSRGESPTSA